MRLLYSCMLLSLLSDITCQQAVLVGGVALLHVWAHDCYHLESRRG